ncbi:MAG: RES domain-containing protein [Betaproteobacteria bacterium]|nr:RES domain-containing protein [Betaproteobacteria bacterium]
MRAVASSARTFSLKPWRAVEAQHRVATMPLVDSLEEQLVLEKLLEESKPPLPKEAEGLHWLLFTPFRYPPPSGGSRFRGEHDAGVFYAADSLETACAELGYWRWRHLRESPAMDHIPTRAQTVFQVAVRARGIDLRTEPFLRSRAKWTSPGDYSATQKLGREARKAGLGLIRYESVRDPGHRGCVAVMTPAAFARKEPIATQTWHLSVFRERVVWRRDDPLAPLSLEFSPLPWERGRG